MGTKSRWTWTAICLFTMLAVSISALADITIQVDIPTEIAGSVIRFESPYGVDKGDGESLVVPNGTASVKWHLRLNSNGLKDGPSHTLALPAGDDTVTVTPAVGVDYAGIVVDLPLEIRGAPANASMRISGYGAGHTNGETVYVIPGTQTWYLKVQNREGPGNAIDASGASATATAIKGVHYGEVNIDLSGLAASSKIKVINYGDHPHGDTFFVIAGTHEWKLILNGNLGPGFDFTANPGNPVIVLDPVEGTHYCHMQVKIYSDLRDPIVRVRNYGTHADGASVDVHKGITIEWRLETRDGDFPSASTWETKTSNCNDLVAATISVDIQGHFDGSGTAHVYVKSPVRARHYDGDIIFVPDAPSSIGWYFDDGVQDGPGKTLLFSSGATILVQEDVHYAGVSIDVPEAAARSDVDVRISGYSDGHVHGDTVYVVEGTRTWWPEVGSHKGSGVSISIPAEKTITVKRGVHFVGVELSIPSEIQGAPGSAKIRINGYGPNHLNGDTVYVIPATLTWYLTVTGREGSGNSLAASPAALDPVALKVVKGKHYCEAVVDIPSAISSLGTVRIVNYGSGHPDGASVFVNAQTFQWQLELCGNQGTLQSHTGPFDPVITLEPKDSYYAMDVHISSCSYPSGQKVKILDGYYGCQGYVLDGDSIFVLSDDDSGSDDIPWQLLNASNSVIASGDHDSSKKRELVIGNFAPKLDLLPNKPSSGVWFEGDAISFNGGFTDINREETHTISIDWDDSSGASNPSVTYNVGKDRGYFTGNHTYADDGIFTVFVTADDASACDNTDTEDFTITIKNVDPTIAVSGDASVDEGSVYTLTLGAITDPGDDTVTSWTVNWGDGNSNTPW